MRMLRLLLGILCAALSSAQSPEEFFTGAGAGFRDTAEEQRLYWRPHIERSHEQILAAARLAAHSEIAILLGAGVCTEIPLEELARRFERVILVDLDGPSLLEAVDGLPLELRGKVELRISDVTSFAGSLMESLEEAADRADTAETAFASFDAIFSALTTGKHPMHLPPADLVVSSLLLSELPRYPMAYADRLIRTRFNRRAREWSGYEEARQRLRHLIVDDHIRILASLCRPGGAVYFGDTIKRGPAYSQFFPEVRKQVETSLSGDFESLGMDGDVTAVIGRMCRGDYGVDAEILAFERLLTAYEQAGADTFEVLVPMDQVRQAWERYGLRIHGQPEAWFWLEYPCAIAHSPGGFRVQSWILRPAKAR